MKTPQIILLAVVIVAIAYAVYAKSASTDQAPNPSAKINIEEVCNAALAYMTFTDGAAAEVFVQDCIDGKHPEVIEQHIKDLGLDGAKI